MNHFFVLRMIPLLIFVFPFSGITAVQYGQWVKHTIDANAPHASIVKVADLNFDGCLDVVAGVMITDHILWYENLGGPTNEFTRHCITQNLDGACGIEIADIDGDDTLDVIGTGGFADDLIWYEKDNPNWIAHPVDLHFDGAVNVVAADIDGDNDNDIVAAGYYADAVVWYENDGPEWISHPIDENLNGARSLFVCDIDGDRDNDVLATGNFADKVILYENDSLNWIPHPIDQDMDGAYGVFVSDINGDGLSDIVVSGNYEGQVVWYENPGWEKYCIDKNCCGPVGIYCADVDLDDDNDVVITEFTGNNIVWYENDHPDWEKHAIDTALIGANDVHVIDMDCDGDSDVVSTGFSGNWIGWYENLLFTEIKSLTGPTAAGIKLSQNYPNPFNHKTEIRYSLPEKCQMELGVYNILGQRVATLVSQSQPAGHYELNWDAEAFVTGIYYYQLVAGDSKKIKKMVLIK